MANTTSGPFRSRQLIPVVNTDDTLSIFTNDNEVAGVAVRVATSQGLIAKRFRSRGEQAALGAIEIRVSDGRVCIPVVADEVLS